MGQDTAAAAEVRTTRKKNAIALAIDLRKKYQDDPAAAKLLSGLQIRLYAENSLCAICGSKTKLLKTDNKTCYSYGLGKFKLTSGCNFCTDHKYFSGDHHQVIRYESTLAATIVEKGYRVTFDLVVKVGRMRYDDHRQLREIQAYLKCSPARIDLPISTIGYIAKRFLECCRLLRETRDGSICEEINVGGGYFLHFDGSTEQKCGQCSLVFMDSRSGHILESSMVNSESYDTIKDALERIKMKYGAPLAVISDLRPGFVRACVDVFGKHVKHILCHYHFLRTFKEEFNQDHQFIKICITQKWQLQAGLSKQLKALKEKLKADHAKELKTLDMIEEYWEKTGDVLGTYRYTLRWVLNYKQDSNGKGVPFDLPFLDLYHRLGAGRSFIDKIFEKSTPAERQKYYRHGFCKLIEKTKNLGQTEAGFRKAMCQLEYAKKWFGKLRAVLFLAAQQEIEDERSLAPLSKKYQLTLHEAATLPQRLKDFVRSLKRELVLLKHPARRAFLENLKSQIEKYECNLHIPLIKITVDRKEILLLPPRTNNCMEALFRFVKCLLRRCCGRSKLPKEFGSVGASLQYYLSMRDHPTFVEIFGDDQKLAEEFAKLFNKQWKVPENLAVLPKRLRNNDVEAPAVAVGA